MSKAIVIETPAQAIDAFGADRIAAACGVDRRTVQNKSAGQFPAYWYAGVQSLADAAGADLRLTAFKFARESAA